MSSEKFNKYGALGGVDTTYSYGQNLQCQRRMFIFMPSYSEKFDLLKDKSGRPEDSKSYYQIAKVDAGFLSWNFHILDEQGKVMAHIERAFRGFGREVGTEITNLYFADN